MENPSKYFNKDGSDYGNLDFQLEKNSNIDLAKIFIIQKRKLLILRKFQTFSITLLMTLPIIEKGLPNMTYILL